MKEKLKKFWESLKKFFNWCAEHEFLSITIVSIVFAFIVHCLFSEYVNEWLSAKWGAGDILTYVSTIFLGALALWQNKRFKEANDKHEEEMRIANEKSQKCLTKLLDDANKIRIRNKTIDLESKKIENISLNIKGFDKSCFPQETHTILQKFLTNEINQDTIYKLKQDAFEKLIELIRSLENDFSGNFKELNKEAIQYYKSFEQTLEYILSINTTCKKIIDGSIDYDKELTNFSNMLNGLANCRVKFNSVASECINKMNIKYSKLLNSLNEIAR